MSEQNQPSTAEKIKNILWIAVIVGLLAAAGYLYLQQNKKGDATKPIFTERTPEQVAKAKQAELDNELQTILQPLSQQQADEKTYRDVLAKLQQLADKDPKQISPKLFVLEIAKTLQDKAVADATAEQLLKAHPDEPAAYMAVGDMRMVLYEGKGAVESFQTALEVARKPGHAPQQERAVLLRTMQAAMRLNQPPLADQMAAELVKKFPDDPGSHVTDGDLKMEIHKGEGAVASYQKALDITRKPGQEPQQEQLVLLRLIQAGVMLKQAPVADQAAADLLAKFPKEPDTHITAGRLRMDLHNGEGAAEAFLKAIDLIKEQKAEVPWILRGMLAEAYLKQNKTAEADAELRAAADSNLFEVVTGVARSSVDLSLRLGQVLLASEKKEETEPAYVLLKHVATIKTADAEAQYWAAVAASRWWESNQEAQQFLDQAIKIKADDPRYAELQAKLKQLPTTRATSQPTTATAPAAK